MAITHICLTCGNDMARTRAVFDADYDLWVVTCTQCSTAAVRRPNAINRLWFKTLRIDIALSIMVVQLVIAFVLILLTRVILDVAANSIDSIGLDATQRDVSGLILAATIVSITTGGWLTAGFSHLNRLFVFLGWSLLLVVSIPMFPPESVSIFESKTLLEHTVIFFFLLIPFMIIAALGIPIGRGLLWLHGQFRRARWRYRRRRARRMRGTI